MPLFVSAQQAQIDEGIAQSHAELVVLEITCGRQCQRYFTKTFSFSACILFAQALTYDTVACTMTSSYLAEK